MSAAEHFDAIVLGANMRGIVAAHVLNGLGFRFALVERGPRAGGADGSFLTKGGARFEIGMHVLDDGRAEMVSRLFELALDGRFHRIVLKRGLAMRGQLMPYAPTPAQMPASLRALLPGETLVDDVGDAPPTRAQLARIYGAGFADLIFDEVLPSFPSEHRHRAFGVDESRLLTNIYPWFFPRARRASSGDESRAFHDRLREGHEQTILYPREGGFGAFGQGLLAKLDTGRAEVMLGASDIRLELEPGTHTIRAVHAKGRVLTARRYFWAGSWEALCGILGVPCQPVASDQVFVGSFVLDRPARSDYHEILVGDPKLRINRVYFPARFRESDDPLMQVEYAVPKATQPSLDPEGWRRDWLADTRALGLLDERHAVVEFDFKTVAMHYNGFGVEGEPLRDADPALIRPDSNLHPVVPSMANLNLTRYIPRTVASVSAVMAR